ncbi:DUF1664 domain-containing protein [Cephalotus follicularis]|uniref:DUF1664 domain-containing protein n=1 Tax=Cephalotus follicularis TaxID=3775 RepID=A0A1Q3D1N6_CEPFO|nr:DUF1664 domain-containing protein [Cephalotus follicularis]
MALPLAKLTILIGAGIVGSVLAKEGRMPNVSDFVSGAFKIVYKGIARDDSTSSSVNKPRSDTLLAQVNSLRQELQTLASNRPITIVTATGTGAGASRCGIVIVVVVVGYGYVWWKGWKLPDMMFATRRSLSDACNSVARNLENVYSSISATKLHLSKRISSVDTKLEEFKVLTTGTHEKVVELQVKSDEMGGKLRSVRDVVQTLHNKISMIEEKQDTTSQGVAWLCDYASKLENIRITERSQALPSSSSRPALELPPESPLRQTESLPPALSIEPSSDPGFSGSHQEFGATISVEVSSRINTSHDANNGFSSSGLLGLRSSGAGGSFITRTRSATKAVPILTRSPRPQ